MSDSNSPTRTSSKPGQPLSGSGVTSRFFEPQQLAGLERLRFTSKRRVEGAYSGRHIAKQRGGSGEFVDYREYAPGDDLRRLDWKARGRTGRNYLKLFQDETDLHCTLFIDGSGSMLQGERAGVGLLNSKLNWVQFFSTALSHLIVGGRDSAGLAVGRQGLDTYLSPGSSMRQLALMHQEIESLKPSGQTDLSKSLDDLMLQSRRRGVLMLLSDFLVDNLHASISAIRKFRVRGWEIIALHIVHPDEEDLPAGNAFRFVGLESAEEASCQVAEVRQAYKARFQRHAEETRALLVGVGCDYHYVSTSQSYVDVLRNFMVARSVG